jgi:murein DD-endopeptidase MepM/ murein hydrolase activator NlpD
MLKLGTLRSKRAKILVALGIIFLAGIAAPERLIIPVQHATVKDWNHQSFWFEPWGPSGVHEGIDIFAPMSTPVLSPTYGIVIYRGQIALGGNVLVVLGPKWRVHYFAHLSKSHASLGEPVTTGEVIAEVGDSGNAKGKPPHLHYSIITLVPYLWRWDGATQGWKKIFFLDPNDHLLESRRT